MTGLSSSDIVWMFASIGLLLAVARGLGECAHRLNQPRVLGELLAGILLGPTVLGTLAPQWTGVLFPTDGPLAVVMDGLTTLAIALFLVVAGLEVNLSTVWQQGRAAAIVGVGGVLFPFLIGFSTAYSFPRLSGASEGAEPFLFALFFATALSISALPVIAKTLMDLRLYRSDLGMVLVAAAVLNDIIGWIIFALVLSLAGQSHGHGLPFVYTVCLTLGFAAVMLTAGRWLIHRVLPWVQAHTTWPGGVLGFALALAMFGAAITQWIGVHAIFGAFLVGVAVGDSSHLRERTRTIISEFVSFIFAPLFFASIGLRVNFAEHFDVVLVLLVLVIATIGKVVGCGVGGRVAGMPSREAWALGFGMNARGAMEIILGLLALQAGLIREPMFVALVVMALTTSLMSGPMMQKLLRLSRPRRLKDFLVGKAFIPALVATEREAVVRELAESLCMAIGIPKEPVIQAVLTRERLMPTGVGNGLAVPHTRVADLTTPAVGIGLSVRGVDFDAPDGDPAHIVFMILSPLHDNSVQLHILTDIARTFGSAEFREQALQTTSHTQLLALLKTEGE